MSCRSEIDLIPRPSKLSDEDKANILNLYLAGIRSTALGKQYGLHPSTILSHLKKLGVNVSKKGINRHPAVVINEQRIVARYISGENVYAIAAEIGSTDRPIYDVLRKWNIPIRDRKECKRKYTHDEAFFSRRPLTAEAAYFAGVLLTDGNITRRKNNSGIVRLSLADEDVLYKLKASISFTGEIHKRSAKNFKNKSQYNITLVSDKTAKALEVLGVIPAKSLIVEAGVEVKNNRDFWRGCIDGDGCIGVYSNKPMLYLCTASLMLANQFQAYCIDVSNSTKCHIYRRAPAKPTHAPFYTVRMSGKTAKLLLAHLYQEGDICMNRKYATAQVAIHT